MKVFKFLNDLILKNFSSKEFHNILALAYSTFLKYAVNVFLSVVVVKYLGTELFGVFSYVNSITAIISVFSGLGLQSIVVKELVLRKNESGEILGSSIFLSFIAGLIAAVLQIILVFILNPSEKIVIYLCLINSLIFFFDTLKIFTYYYESEVNSRIVAKINNSTLIITTFFKVFAVYFDTGIYSIALIYVLDYAISGLLLLFIFSKNELPISKLIVKKSACLDLLKKSLPLIFSGFFIVIYMKIDQVLIKNILGNSESGIFAIVVRLTEIWYFIPVIIQSTLFPKIVNKHKLGSDGIEAQIRLYRILIIFSLLVIFFTAVFGRYIINILFGSDFNSAFGPLMVSIWALLFVSIGVARNSYILSFNLNKLYLYSTIIGAIINIGLNFVLLKKFGIIGASISTVVSYCISAHISSYFFKELRSQFFIVNNVFFSLITFRKS